MSRLPPLSPKKAGKESFAFLVFSKSSLTSHCLSFFLSPQPDIKHPPRRYTNCIVTLIWADGVMRTPPIMFTYNPKLLKATDLWIVRRKEGRQCKLTKQRRENLDVFERTMQEFSLQPWQVQALYTKNETYVRETPQLLREAFHLWKKYASEPLEFDQILLFSDCGRCFTEGGVSLFPQLGVDHWRQYPPAVHQFLSPNDNSLHGAAKAKWRADPSYEDSDVRGPLNLLRALTYTKAESIESWFVENFLLDDEIDRKTSCEDICGKEKIGSIDEEFFDMECMYFYQNEVVGSVDSEVSRVIRARRAIDSTLDGVYWTTE